MKRNTFFSNSWYIDRVGPVLFSYRDTNRNVFKVTDWDFAKGKSPKFDSQILLINYVVDNRD